ncbi:MAG TPA: hypothetical protein VJL90_07935 [Pseudorhodoplanes sp.]|nr:hypothetical protein [Pseudorhodoplanes sp.]
MTTFRKTLMATTMLAGFAIVALDAAQAGPNGGPSLGSISGFSSMRMDFNRVGGLNRALSRDDTRVVPLVVKNTDNSEKSDKSTPKKGAAKKGVNTAHISNPKSVAGGKGKESVSGAQNLHIPAALAEIYRITGGNLDDLSQLAELADRLKIGPLVAGNPAFPKGDGEYVWPEEFGQLGRQPSGGDKSEDRYWGLNGWSGYSNAPGVADTSKTGWAGIWSEVPGSRRERDGYRQVSYHDPATGRNGTVTTRWGNDGESSREITVGGTDSQSDNDWTVRTTHHNANGSHTRRTDTTDVVYGNREDEMSVFRSTTITTSGEGPTSQPGNQEPYDYVAPEPKDSQPVAEGTGRPGRTGWCSPTGGCVIASPIPPRRIIPTEESSTPPAHRQSPGWATDPSEEGYTGGRGGDGYNGYRPQDEEGGGIGGPGNPELSALSAPL